MYLSDSMLDEPSDDFGLEDIFNAFKVFFPLDFSLNQSDEHPLIHCSRLLLG